MAQDPSNSEPLGIGEHDVQDHQKGQGGHEGDGQYLFGFFLLAGGLPRLAFSLSHCPSI